MSDGGSTSHAGRGLRLGATWAASEVTLATAGGGKRRLMTDKLVQQLLVSIRAALGTLVSLAIANYAPGVIGAHVTPLARFFAGVLPSLGARPTLGASMALMSSSPLIFATCFVAWLLEFSHLNHIEHPVQTLALVILFAAGFHYGTVRYHPSSALSVKLSLATGLVSFLSDNKSSELALGFAIGYVGIIAGVLLPYPRLAYSQMTNNFSLTRKFLGQSLSHLLSDFGSSEQPSVRRATELVMHQAEKLLNSCQSFANEARSEFALFGVLQVDQELMLLRNVLVKLQGLRWAIDVLARDSALARLPPHFVQFKRDVLVAIKDMCIEEAIVCPPNLDLWNQRTLEFRERLLQLRRVFVSEEYFNTNVNRQAKGGLHNWSRDERFSHLNFLFVISNVYSLLECLKTEIPQRRFRFDCWEIFRILRQSVSLWNPLVRTPEQIINTIVLTIISIIGAIFVLVPSLSALIPGTLSVPLAAIFVFSNASFGLTLNLGNQRLVGFLIGGTISFFTLIPAYEWESVERMFIVSLWVFVATMFLGLDASPTAAASIFAVVALVINVPDNTVSALAQTFLVNSIGVMLTSVVSAVAWVLSVAFRKERSIGKTFEQCQTLLSDCFATMIERISSGAMGRLQLDQVSTSLRRGTALVELGALEPDLFRAKLSYATGKQFIRAATWLHFCMTFLDTSTAAVTDVRTSSYLVDHGFVSRQTRALLREIQREISALLDVRHCGDAYALADATNVLLEISVDAIRRAYAHVGDPLIESRPLIRYLVSVYFLRECSSATIKLYKANAKFRMEMIKNSL